MTDENNETTDNQPDDTTAEPHGSDNGTNDEAEKPDTTDWKAQARKWEARAKADHAKLDALAPKASSADSLQSKVDELTKRIDGYEKDKRVAGWRAKVSKETGVDPSLLSGDSLDAMRSQAQKLAAWQKQAVDKALHHAGPVIPNVEDQHAGAPKGNGMRAFDAHAFGASD